MGLSNPKLARLKSRAPQIIAAAIIIAIAAYVAFELLEDVLIEQVPITSDPWVSAIISFTKNVTGTVSSWGYAGIFSLMLLESSSLPVPSEVVLPFAGYLVSKMLLNFWFVIAVSTVAAIAGSLIDYYIGLKGIQVLTRHRILGRAVLSTDQLAFAGRWFTKYGSFIVFIARLIPGLRTIISFPAGAAKMPLAKFVAFTTVGCIIWNTVLVYVGYYLGKNWTEVAAVLQYILITVVIALVLLAVIYLVVRRRRRRAQTGKP